jgi:uncharacterized membrane protein YeaQ/YmgE (transglycosylase-associated protein family)
MLVSWESFALIVIVGVVIGWLAVELLPGISFGLIPEILIAVLGAFAGVWLLPSTGIRVGTGLVSVAGAAVIGSVLLLLVARLVRIRI